MSSRRAIEPLSAILLAVFVAAFIGGLGCAPKADCRQASAACAAEFTCVDSGGQWVCAPAKSGVEKSEAATREAATPVFAPDPRLPQRVGPRTRREAVAMTEEAKKKVREIFDAAASAYAGSAAEADARRFPRSATLTPLAPPRCAGGRPVPFESTAADWQHPTWKRLGFAVEGQHFYRYEFLSEGTGTKAQFTARALGDLDCDGVLATFERVGFIDMDGDVNGGAGLYQNLELE